MEQKQEVLNRWDRLVKVFTQEKNTVLIRTKGHVYTDTVEPYLASTTPTLMRLLPECSLFSLLAYQLSGPSNDVRQVPTPKTAKKYYHFLKDWIEVTDILNMDASYRAKHQRKTYRGLHYRCFYNNQSKTIIIAFRGSTSELGDWISNARWVTRFITSHDDHYDVIGDQIDALLDSIFETLAISNDGTVQVMTTGHSLGGGLATHAAYAAKRINDVIAINASPVTAYKSVPKDRRNTNEIGLTILRIFEHGEVLAYLRLPLRVFYPLARKDPEIIETRFNFGIRRRFDWRAISRSITQHGLPVFTRELWKTARNIVEPDLALMADKVLTNNKRIKKADAQSKAASVP